MDICPQRLPQIGFQNSDPQLEANLSKTKPSKTKVSTPNSTEEKPVDSRVILNWMRKYSEETSIIGKELSRALWCEKYRI